MSYGKVLRGTGFMATSTAVGNVLSLARTIVIVRALTVKEFGIFSLLFALAGLTGTLVLPSFASAIQVYYPQFRLQNRQSADSFLSATLLWTLGWGLAVAGLLWAAWRWIALAIYGEAALLPFLGVVALILVLNPLNDHLEAFLLSMERFRAYAFLSVWFPLIALVLSAVAAVLDMGIAGFLLAMVGAEAASLLGAAWLMRKHLNHVEWKMPREVLRFWVPLAGTTAVKAIQSNVPTLLIGKILGLEAVGLYAIARKTAEIIPNLLSPYFSSLNVVALNLHARARNEFEPLFNRGLRHTMAVACYGAGVLAISAPALISILYGQQYALADWLLKAAAFAVALLTLQFFFKTGLLAEKLPHYFMWGTLTGALANAALFAALPLWFGLNGVGYAQLGYALVTVGIMQHYLRKAGQKIPFKSVGLPFIVAGLLATGLGGIPGDAFTALAGALVFTMLFWGALFGLGFLDFSEMRKAFRMAKEKLGWAQKKT